MDRTEVFWEEVASISMRPVNNVAYSGRRNGEGCRKINEPMFTAINNILLNLEEASQCLLSNFEDFSLPGRLSERQRDDIDATISRCLQMGRKELDTLKIYVLGSSKRGNGAAVVAHHHGILLIVTERLAGLMKDYDHLCNISLEHNRSAKSGLWPTLHGVPPTLSQTPAYGGVETNEGAHQMQEQLDGRGGQLNARLEISLRVEKSVEQIAYLSSLLSQKIMEQAEQIELLYDAAVEASLDINLGNQELRKAVSRGVHSRVVLSAIYIVASLCILLLHHLSP